MERKVGVGRVHAVGEGEYGGGAIGLDSRHLHLLVPELLAGVHGEGAAADAEADPLGPVAAAVALPADSTPDTLDKARGTGGGSGREGDLQSSAMCSATVMLSRSLLHIAETVGGPWRQRDRRRRGKRT